MLQYTQSRHTIGAGDRSVVEPVPGGVARRDRVRVRDGRHGAAVELADAVGAGRAEVLVRPLAAKFHLFLKFWSIFSLF